MIPGGESAVTIGWGYWRVTSDFLAPDSMDQELKINPIRNPLHRVYGPRLGDAGRVRMRIWVIISHKMKRQDYEREYPDAQKISYQYTGSGDEHLRMGDQRRHSPSGILSGA